MKKVVFSIVMLLVMGLAFGCGKQTNKTNSQNNNTNVSKDGNKVGEGKNSFLLNVVDEKGTKIEIHVSTDKKTVGEALVELGIIKGDEGQYGLYVHTVCDMTYRYEVDKKYWAFYINDEYATTGVDSTNIKPGDIYTLKVQAE